MIQYNRKRAWAQVRPSKVLVLLEVTATGAAIGAFVDDQGEISGHVIHPTIAAALKRHQHSPHKEFSECTDEEMIEAWGDAIVADHLRRIGLLPPV